MTTEQRRLAAIVSADVAGYSRLMGRDESGTLAALKALRHEVVDPAIASHGGRAYLGDHAEAVVRLERAIRLSPLDLLAYYFYTGMGWANLFLGRYDEAVSWARKAALEKPDWASTVRAEVIACALSGRIVEAREGLARLRAIDPDYRLPNPESIRSWRRAEDRALYIEGLRRAGLPG